jgi:hypothetical protein
MTKKKQQQQKKKMRDVRIKKSAEARRKAARDDTEAKGPDLPRGGSRPGFGATPQGGHQHARGTTPSMHRPQGG